MLSPWQGVGAALGTAAILLGTLLLVRRRTVLPGEVVRKLIHLSTTSVSLSFPWLFRDSWPPLFLALFTLVLMALVRTAAPLRRIVDGFGLGESLRLSSLGEFYYPFAIAALFVATRGRTLEYVVPLCAAGFGDAAAAVVGKAVGRLSFRSVSGETKSLEGSLAFFGVTFAAAAAALGGGSGRPPGEAVLLAGIVSVDLAMVEAIAWKGLDNLFVPFGGLLLLRSFERAGHDTLVAHLSLATCAAVFATGWLLRPRVVSRATRGFA